jgi:hypothetical protein
LNQQINNPMKAINLKVKYGSNAFYEAVKCAFASGHIVTNMKGASNYAAWVLHDPTRD